MSKEQYDAIVYLVLLLYALDVIEEPARRKFFRLFNKKRYAGMV